MGLPQGAIVAWRAEMRIFDLALAGVLAITAPMAAHANGPGSNLRATNAGPASNLVLVWDGGGSGGHSGAIGGRPPADRDQQWNRGAGFAHRGPNRQYGGVGPVRGAAPPARPV